MTVLVRSVVLAATMSACGVNVSAQETPLVFTAGTAARSSSEPTRQVSAAIEERGLALWSGAASDFGLGVSISASRWTVRSSAGIRTLTSPDGRRPAFQQIEVVRSLFSTGSLAVAGGGGLREEWDGTRVLIGRVLAGADVRGGRLQGSLVVERFIAAPVTITHDAADVVTSVGWSRRVADGVSVGVEGIGQDLEGLWNPAEADGGAKLLAGPSLHLQSKSGHWTASLVAGPVLHRRPDDATAAQPAGAGRRFGLFASATWTPSIRHDR